mmetsp:Transcript_32828/g.45829  ORF Transcript_32828/g.45829 Transcript_32828/m.45829 type:complete len:97 (+) Transcript_32828:211-501(+)
MEHQQPRQLRTRGGREALRPLKDAITTAASAMEKRRKGEIARKAQESREKAEGGAETIVAARVAALDPGPDQDLPPVPLEAAEGEAVANPEGERDL